MEEKQRNDRNEKEFEKAFAQIAHFFLERPCAFFAVPLEVKDAVLGAMEESELTFVMATFNNGRSERDICCLVDSCFTANHFDLLCCYWQEKYDLGPVFISRPRLNEHASILGTFGRVCKNGKAGPAICENPTFDAIGSYFQALYGERWTFIESALTEGRSREIYNWMTYISIHHKFLRIFPMLDKKK